MNILVIDNYDSFTYNLVQLIGSAGAEVTVRRNDEISLSEIDEMHPDGVILSPGPGRPEDAGVTLTLIKNSELRIPVLGVCLGHQAIGLAFGARVGYAPSLMHGRRSPIRHNGAPLYRDVADPFLATRYHSLVVEAEGLPAELVVTAWTDDGIIMGLKHRTLPIEGVQYHPESILTESGDRILSNWLEGLR